MRRVSRKSMVLVAVLAVLAGATGLAMGRPQASDSPQSPAQEYTVAVAPSKDTFVALGVLASVGTLESLRAGWRNGADYWTYMQFDFEERLPTNTTIVSATLRMWCKEESYHQNPTGDPWFQLKRVRTSWNEDDTVYKNKPQAVEPSVDWIIPRCKTPGWRSVEVTSMVQQWYDGTFENMGWQLGPRNDAPEHLFTFQSREHQSPPPIGKQPQLWITFTGGETPTVPPTVTLTPTDTSTPTITPTVTDTPVPTDTPTDTPTPLPTDTPLPAYVPVCADDAGIGITPTAEATSEEPTPEATAEATPESTPESP